MLGVRVHAALDDAGAGSVSVLGCYIAQRPLAPGEVPERVARYLWAMRLGKVGRA